MIEGLVSYSARLWMLAHAVVWPFNFIVPTMMAEGQGIGPVITHCSSDQTVFVGETAVLSVAVSGTPPFRYQWGLGYAPIPDATNATLVFTNARFNSANDQYWVTVSNDFGMDIRGEIQLTVLPRSPIAGFLDPTFKGPAGFGNALLIQPDGRLLAGGSRGVVRLWPDGGVDSSFSSNTVETVVKMALQSDGKVVVVSGGASLPRCRSRLLRLNADGTVDSSFTVDLTGNDPFIISVCISALAMQADDKALVAYRVLRVGDEDDLWLGPIVRRLNPDGSIDSSFPIYPSSCDGIEAMTVTDDGGILVASWQRLVRILPDGRRDTNFIVSSLGPPANYCQAPGLVYAFAFQPDGKILIAGAFTSVQDQPRSRIARLDSDGALDLSFDPPLSSGSEEIIVKAIALQPDGKVLVGGNFETMDNEPREGLARLNPDGSLDHMFITGTGLLGDLENSVLSIRVQSPGKAIVGGHVEEYWGVPQNGLMRIYLAEAPADADADGLPDTWETHYFGSLNASSGGPTSDADSDGMNNRNEYQAGTSPVCASSVLRILSLEQTGDRLCLRFGSVAGKRYQLEHTDELSNSEWESTGPPTVGTGEILCINLPVGAPARRQFYRLRLLEG